jgi:phosphate transport system protein
MPEHTVKAFDTELHELASEIAKMGALVEKQIAAAAEVLGRYDVEQARRIIGADVAIDQLQREIEEKAILTIARRQPMAVDLREIVGALRIANALERVGDYAKNIGKRIIATGPLLGPADAVHRVRHMADLVLAATHQVLDAYTRRDLAQALAVWRGDEAIDQANNSLFRELLAVMIEDSRSIPACTHLLFCAKNIERMGDHATNIAESVYYIIQGVPIEAERPKSDAIGLDATTAGPGSTASSC